jgi:drug/metabolite transporter (DMT)-like permease
MTVNRRALAWLAILFTTIVWASSLVLAKIIYPTITPILFVALRYTLALPFLLLLLFFKKDDVKDTQPTKWSVIIIVGLAGPFLSQILQYIGLSLTSASETLLLLNLSPVFAVILAAPLIKEEVTRQKLVGLMLAVSGATLIVLGDFDFQIVSYTRIMGDLIIVVSTLLFALNGIAGKVAIKTSGSLSVTSYSTLVAVPFIWLTAFLFEDITILFSAPIHVWIIICWLAIVNTAIAFLFYYESMKYIEASKVQIALSLIAVWGLIMSSIFLGESISFTQIFGGIATILGVIVVQHRRRQKEAIVPAKSIS